MTPDVESVFPVSEIAARLMKGLPSPVLTFDILTDSVHADMRLFTSHERDQKRIGDVKVLFNSLGKMDQVGSVILRDGWQGHSLGKQIMRNVMDVSQLHESRGLALSTRGIGGYAWQNFGFALTQAEWDLRRPELEAKFDKEFKHQLPPTTTEKLRALLQSGDPRTIREIAKLKDDIVTFSLQVFEEDPNTRLTVRLPVGKAMLSYFVMDMQLAFSSEPDMRQFGDYTGTTTDLSQKVEGLIAAHKAAASRTKTPTLHP